MIENICNATVTLEKMIPMSNLAMIRFEKTFNFLAEEPLSIAIKNELDSEEELYARVLRIRIWKCSGKSTSWGIYSKDREELRDIVVRKVMWDMDKDIKEIKTCVLAERKNLLQRGPSISCVNKYISHPKSEDINQSIKCLDKQLENGFILKENKKPSWEWRDMELLRLFDWGQIHLTLSPDKTNELVENEMKKIIFHLDAIIEEQLSTISYMALNFELPIEKYREIYIEQ